MPRKFSIDFSAVGMVPKGTHQLADYPICEFSNKDYEPLATLPDNIKLVSIIHLSDQSSVYGASGTIASASGELKLVKLVVKFASLRALATEASVYDHLAECGLAKTVSPEFFGMLLASPPNDKRALGCIITELWGSSLKTNFYELAKVDKAKILDQLVALHDIGIKHCDFEPNNVLQQGGEFRIIDFGRVDINHECSRRPGRYNFAAAGEYMFEGDREYLCSSVLHVALEMRLWEHANIRLLGENWILGVPWDKSVYKLPLQHEIFSFPLPQNKRHFSVAPELFDEWNLQFYLEVRRQRDNGLTLEELKSDENMDKLMDAADAGVAIVAKKRAQLET
ncbi:hypothetical protein C8J56DRAFT_882136 [Mycena floridula]|nr:hypothetical protein C8J56DRAFT_882136 [Mycena floridula]